MALKHEKQKQILADVKVLFFTVVGHEKASR